MADDEVDSLQIDAVVDRIVARNTQIRDFWSDAYGWAPIEAAELLSKSRLDWQVSLSHSLRLWTASTPTGVAAEGCLILAWANLGSLVEGTIRLYLSVWYSDYKQNEHALQRAGQLVDPDVAMLEKLRHFLAKNRLLPGWDAWIQHIQSRRNAIHAFRHREIGNFEEIYAAVRKYLEFLINVDSGLPYP